MRPGHALGSGRGGRGWESFQKRDCESSASPGSGCLLSSPPADHWASVWTSEQAIPTRPQCRPSAFCILTWGAPGSRRQDPRWQSAPPWTGGVPGLWGRWGQWAWNMCGGKGLPRGSGSWGGAEVQEDKAGGGRGIYLEGPRQGLRGGEQGVPAAKGVSPETERRQPKSPTDPPGPKLQPWTQVQKEPERRNR